MGTVGNVLGLGYRQSVLNDFSIVSKATFYVINTNIVGGKKVYSCGKILPVQINPHDIARSSRRSHVTGKSLAKALLDGSEVPSNDDHDTLDLELLYDMYDEYMATTGEGIIDGLGYASLGTQHMGNTFSSLNDEKATSLPDLIKCADDNNSVLFKWGTLEYFGKITSLSSRYDVFSRWGEPLKARVNIVITQETGEAGRPITLQDLGTGVESVVETRVKTEATLNTIALGTTTALR